MLAVGSKPKVIASSKKMNELAIPRATLSLLPPQVEWASCTNEVEAALSYIPPRWPMQLLFVAATHSTALFRNKLSESVEGVKENGCGGVPTEKEMPLAVMVPVAETELFVQGRTNGTEPFGQAIAPRYLWKTFTLVQCLCSRVRIILNFLGVCDLATRILMRTTGDTRTVTLMVFHACRVPGLDWAPMAGA